MKHLIRSVPDFPKKGVTFRDLFPILQHHHRELVDALVSLVEDPLSIDVVGGIESRGFIFASAIASALNKGFVPIRKKGKLPPPTKTVDIDLEYGSDTLEMAYGKGRMLLVDDVMATGGTLQGAAQLARQVGYEVREALVVIHLKDLSNSVLHEGKIPVKYLYDF